jgi:hypothetical protein
LVLSLPESPASGRGASISRPVVATILHGYVAKKMRTRWINHTSSPDLPLVGRAVIATYWPGRYYLVLTTQVDSATPLRIFLRSVALKVAFENVPHERDIFMTQIFKCNKQGSHKATEKPLYEGEYSTYLDALNGHNKIVESIVNGQLKLD